MSCLAVLVPCHVTRQLLHRVRDASQVARFFHGGSRRSLSLADPSSSPGLRNLPPSVLMAAGEFDEQALGKMGVRFPPRGGGGGDGGVSAEEQGVIDLPSCRQVVAQEVHRLESGLEEQTARLDRLYRG